MSTKPQFNNPALLAALANEQITTVVQTAPSVRVGIGELFGYAAGTVLTGKLVGALRQLGFDYVFDTTFAADIVIIEENAELEDRVFNHGHLPMLNSCCPGFERYLAKNFPDLRAKHMATTKSPMEVLGALVKTYFAQKNGLDPRNIFSVATMPCLIKKLEAQRAELRLADGLSAVDTVLTTVELGQLLHEKGIDLRDCVASEYDPLMGISSGAARLFGISGGVSEATLRYHAHKHHRQILGPVSAPLPGYENARELTFEIAGKAIRILVINGLKSAGLVLANSDLLHRYHFVEVMSCPGGCVGGSGQPQADSETIAQRKQGLRALDADASYSAADQNPAVQALYSDFLGQPGGAKSRELLHVHAW